VAPKPGPARLAFVFGKESRILQPVSPLLVALSAVILTSVVLLAVDPIIDTEALAFIYLLPTVVLAMHYGSTVGVLTSFASALAAAYFCFPPKFSFFISDPLNVAELGFFLLLALIASKAVAVVTRDESRDKVTLRRPKWWNPSSRAISSVARIISYPFSR
jgi:K+-sensing histidine kinase KdpD